MCSSPRYHFSTEIMVMYRGQIVPRVTRVSQSSAVQGGSR
jgi:hypothetical protein